MFTVELWTTVMRAAGDAFYLVAAIITLIVALRDFKRRNDKRAR